LRRNSFSGTLWLVPNSAKRATSFRLTATARTILKRLAKKWGANRTYVIEALLRAEDKR